jgi:hypothetical protein
MRRERAKEFRHCDRFALKLSSHDVFLPYCGFQGGDLFVEAGFIELRESSPASISRLAGSAPDISDLVRAPAPTE